MSTEVVMPQMGESIAEGTITKWLKKVGERVERDEPLFEISTDKVDAEIPSPAAGKITAVKVKTGDRVSAGSVIATLESADAKSTDTKKTAAAPPAADPRPEPKPAQAAPRAQAGEPRVVTVPDLGDFADVPIIDVLVKAA